MKIAIFNITAGGISGGYRKYLCNMIPGLAAHSAVESILCISPVSWNVASWFDSMPNVEFASFKPIRFLWRGINSALREKLKTFSPDVIFVPTEHPFCFEDIPVINMIQNMEPLGGVNQALSFLERLKNWVRAYYAKKAINKATQLIAPSEFVKDFLMNQRRVPESKVKVIYYGGNYFTADKLSGPSNLPQDWNGKFIFTAGSIRPARGLEDIFNAMHYMSERGQNDICLVIAGEASSGTIVYQNRLKRWIAQQGLSNRICWVGGVTEKEMEWCYRHCAFFIMSSRIESFGMVILEALSNDCVCIAANNRCLPEIFGEAALYYSPRNVESLVEKIQFAVCCDVENKMKMKRAAKKRAAEFSWDVCVEKTVAEFEKVIKDRRR
ncbi:MAG: hypothetical protein A2103_01210 [Gammaproteobacteria bacterium GWF2_41_13]|nr:MAG: hypothetical protein A2103_01210 [Gammaproteobacteria bacterium GWF2_41_13]